MAADDAAHHRLESTEERAARLEARLDRIRDRVARDEARKWIREANGCTSPSSAWQPGLVSSVLSPTGAPRPDSPGSSRRSPLPSGGNDPVRDMEFHRFEQEIRSSFASCRAPDSLSPRPRPVQATSLLSPQVSVPSLGPSAAEQLFEQLDANHDGYIDRQEWSDAVGGMQASRRTPQFFSLASPEQAARTLGETFDSQVQPAQFREEVRKWRDNQAFEFKFGADAIGPAKIDSAFDTVSLPVPRLRNPGRQEASPLQQPQQQLQISTFAHREAPTTVTVQVGGPARPPSPSTFLERERLRYPHMSTP